MTEPDQLAALHAENTRLVGLLRILVNVTADSGLS